MDTSPPNVASYSDGDRDTMDLLCPVEAVSFLVGAEATSIFMATAFDADGVAVDSTAVEINPGMQSITLLGSIGSEIKSVEYETFSCSLDLCPDNFDPEFEFIVPTFAVDSVPVPEPSGLVVRFASLVVLLGLGRLRKNA